MRIAIVEDDEAMQRQLSGYLSDFYRERGGSCQITAFADGDEILENYKAAYDLIFLDIHMQRVDGMKTAEKIRQLDENVFLVFVTNLANYAIRGYSVGALDFLLKPVNYLMLKQLLIRVDKLMAARDKRFITLPTEKGMARLDVGQVYYVETEGHNLNIYTSQGIYRQRESMKNMESTLSGYHFARCNNCYLVNLAQVQRVEKSMVVVGDHELAISRPRYKQFMDALTRYLGGGKV